MTADIQLHCLTSRQPPGGHVTPPGGDVTRVFLSSLQGAAVVRRALPHAVPPFVPLIRLTHEAPAPPAASKGAPPGLSSLRNEEEKIIWSFILPHSQIEGEE